MANIIEDRAQWRDKTKGLSNLIIVSQCACPQRMNEGAALSTTEMRTPHRYLKRLYIVIFSCLCLFENRQE